MFKGQEGAQDEIIALKIRRMSPTEACQSRDEKEMTALIWALTANRDADKKSLDILKKYICIGIQNAFKNLLFNFIVKFQHAWTKSNDYILPKNLL